MATYGKILSRRQVCAGVAASSITAFRASGCAPPMSSTTTVRTITFPGTYNLLIWAAQANGLLASAGMSAMRERTTTSMFLVQSLVGGEFDIAASSIDNVIAYNEGQGEAALDQPADLIAVAGILPNLVLPLIVQPDITSLDVLAGRRLAVDAASTGFSFVLRAILASDGLTPDDYELVSVGSARERYDALQAGRYAGAILTPPFDRMAEAAGLRRLADSRTAFGQYQGTCFVTTRTWARDNRAELIGFLRAMVLSIEWILDADNTAAAEEILLQNMPNMSNAAAADGIAELRDTLSLDLNMEGVATVLALRSQYGQPQKTLADPARYIDVSYLEAARTTLSSRK